jgi:hypothetical protein
MIDPVRDPRFLHQLHGSISLGAEWIAFGSPQRSLFSAGTVDRRYGHSQLHHESAGDDMSIYPQCCIYILEQEK